MDAGAARLVGGLLLAAALCGAYGPLVGTSSRRARCAYLAAASVLVLLVAYGPGVLPGALAPAAWTYACARLLRRWRPMPHVVLAGLLAHLSAVHVARLRAPAGAADHSGVLMVGVMRLSSFAYDAAGRGPAGRAVGRLPGPLAFLAWALFLPGLLAGPFVPWADFAAFLSGAAAASVRKAGAGRFRVVRLARVVLVTLVCAGVHVALGPLFPAEAMAEAPFARASLPYRVLFARASNTAGRCKYYVAWGLAEAAHLLLGLGFRPDAPDAWDAACNADPLAIEAAADFRALVGRWNVATNRWLHAYVYVPAGASVGRGPALVLTYLVSAFWHGFHPAYYLVFATGAWVTAVARMAHARLSHPLRRTPALRRVVDNAATMALASYVLTPFVLLDLRRTLRLWAAFRFAGHVLLFAAHVGLCFVPRRPAAPRVVA